MKALKIQKSNSTQGFGPSLIFKVIIKTLLIASSFWAHNIQAQNISVTVSRDASNYYTATGGLTGVIKTQTCFQFVFFNQATLQLFSASTGRLIFSNGQQCNVSNVFEPATVSPGGYLVTVNSNSDGYFELTDGSYLVKAFGNTFAFSQSATLNIQSAVNGTASGTITLGNSFSYSLANIWWQRAALGPTVDLVLTGLDLRTAPWDSGGVAVSNPESGASLYPHLFFDVVGGSIPAIKLYEIRLGGALLCDGFVNGLERGSYWVACGPISVPSSDFTLSAILDPNGSLVEVSELNNSQTRTYRVKTDEIFKDRFEQ